MNGGHRAQIRATALAVKQVSEVLDGFCAAEQLPQDVAWRLRLALDEVVANIVSYATPAGSSTEIDVLFRMDAGVVEVTVTDNGPPFDPLARPAPDVTAPLEVRQPGGLGIALVKSLMDDVRYTRTSRNVLTIRKRVVPDTPTEDTGPDENRSEHT